MRWVNAIAYVDSARREHTVAVLECLETRQAPHATPQTTRFQWITNFVITHQNACKLANQGGRLRWIIENDGFNDQKHGGYALEYPYSTPPPARFSTCCSKSHT